MIPLYTSYLTPTEYGVYDLITSTVSLLVPILTLNIIDGIMRFSLDKKESKPEVATIGFRYSIIGFIIAFCLVCINYFFQVLTILNGIEFFVIAYIFLNIFFQYVTQLAKGFEKIFELGMSSIIGTISIIFLNIYFLVYIKLGFHGFFLAGIISLLCQILYLGFTLKLWRIIKPFFVNKTLEKRMLQYSIPLIFTCLSWWLNSTADKYITALYCGITSNGLLAISYKIPTILNTIQSFFIQAWQISAIKEYGNNNCFYKKMFDYYNLVVCLICSILIMLNRIISVLLFAKEFYAAWEYVPLLLFCCLMNGEAGFIGPILSARKDSRALAISAILSSITNIVMNFILTYYYGVHGAVIATVISSYIMYKVRKESTGNLVESNNYNSIIVCWFLLIIQCILEICFQNYIYQILIFFLITILLRRVLLEIIMKLNDLIKKHFVIKNSKIQIMII